MCNAKSNGVDYGKQSRSGRVERSSEPLCHKNVRAFTLHLNYAQSFAIFYQLCALDALECTLSE